MCPAALGGWVIWNKSEPLASLEHTIEADERIAADGSVLVPLDRRKLEKDLQRLRGSGIEALTVCLFNGYVSGEHERLVAEVAEKVLPGIPVSLSSEVIAEMYEYERTETTVVNSYVRPVVSKYVDNLQRELHRSMGDVQTAHPALRRGPFVG